MKKVFLSIAIVAVLAAMVSCGNKTVKGGDSDSTALADSMVTMAPGESGSGYQENMQDSAGEHVISDEGVASPQGDGQDAEEWDVSVRTTDLEEQEPRYEAIFRDASGNTIQVAEGHTVDYPQDMLRPFGNVWQADVNFDGHTDIMICLGMMPASDQVITYYDAWLYNPQTGKFNHHEGFRDIANPEVDNVNKYVKAHYLLRDGKNKHYTAFVIQSDGTQKMVKEWKGEQ